MANDVQRVTNTASDLHQYADTYFEHLIAAKSLTYRAQENRTCRPGVTTALIPSSFGAKLLDIVFANQYHSTLWQRQGGALVQLGIAPQTAAVNIEVAAGSPEERESALRELKDLFPMREIPPDREEVMLAFWSLTPNGARGMERSISIAPWERVKGNYTPQTQAGLAPLMASSFRPTKAGQLVLWYGAPGTGKTHALRALTWEWRKWCTYHYITDPEVFFGGNANYMLDVLLMRDGNIDVDDPPPSGPYGDQRNGAEKEKKWRLLILEDSGELMVPDAKAQTGQGLSRLLNVVDGLIGQGLKIMVLVTTNEILKKLHPAVARPGRCAARIEFGEFTKADAGLWLQANGGDVASLNGSTGASLAELYSAIGAQQTISETKAMPVGFGG